VEIKKKKLYRFEGKSHNKSVCHGTKINAYYCSNKTTEEAIRATNFNYITIIIIIII
jgi:hypothetical protein